MTEKGIESVKKDVRSLLISYQKGLSLEEFRKSYRTLLGVKLPGREFGYTSDIEFLYSIPDVVHVQVDHNGITRLFGIADESTEHIKKLVQLQRPNKPKTNNKSSNSAFYKPASIVPNNSSVRCRPFIPALLRAEIIQVVKQYPDGIGYLSLAAAYKNIYNKTLNLEWLSSYLQERLGKLANAVPELEVKIVNGLEKLFLIDQKWNNLSNGVTVAGSYCKLQRLKEIARTHSTKSNCSSQFSKELLNTLTVSENSKCNMEKVLKQYPLGVLAVHFPILYEKVTQQPFDLHEMGFNNLLDLVDTLPEIFFRTESPESSKDWILFHIENSTNSSNLGCKTTPISQNCAPVLNSSHYHRKTNLIVDIAPPDLEYIQPQLPEDAHDMFIPVFVSAFINPSLFWFQLQTDEALESLRRLEDEMVFFYNSQPRSRYQMADVDILIGASCVAFSPTDNHWYRAVISSLPNLEYINVLFVDYGSWEKVPRNMLSYLKYNFIRYPAHAFKAKLAKLKPPSQKGVWDTEAQKRFLQLCNKATIMAKIDSIENQTFSVFLWDSTDDEEIHINDTLLNEGYAECSRTHEQSSALSPNQDYVNGVKFNSPPLSRLKEKADESPLEVNHDKSHVSLLNGIQKLNFQSKQNKSQQMSISKRSVKKIQLGDGYKINLILVSNEVFVSGSDVSNLLWSGKKADLLACRLEFKEVYIPTITIEKNAFPDLFLVCERCFVNGFDSTEDYYSVSLYPLTYLIKILNIFGHPSVVVRETILKEIKDFNPSNLAWTEKDNYQDEHQSTNGSDDKLERLCLYDLKTIKESLQCKRLKLLDHYEKRKDDNLVIQLKNLELNQSLIAKRIEEIEAICSTYVSSCYN